MKKIIGSPIGLGEVNLTVDKRVRRCIKEYFGNVETESNNDWTLTVENDYPLAKSPENTNSKEGYYVIKIIGAGAEYIQTLNLVDRYFVVLLDDKKIYFQIKSHSGARVISEYFFILKKDIKEIEEKYEQNIAKLIPVNDTVQINTAKDFIEKEKAKFEDWKLEREAALEAAREAARKEALPAKKALLKRATKVKEFLKKLYEIEPEDATEEQVKDAEERAKEEAKEEAKENCESQDCKEYIEDGLNGSCVPNYKDNESGEKNKDGTVKDCDETDGTSCCASPKCIIDRKKYQRKAWRSWLIVLSTIIGFIWIVSFFKYSDVYVRRFGGFLLWIHNLVRNKDQPKIEPNINYGIYETPDGGRIDKLRDSGLFLFGMSVLLGLLIWRIVENETGDPYLRPCDDKIKNSNSTSTCKSNFLKYICADGTHKCVLCGINRRFSTTTCSCVSTPSSNKTSGSIGKSSGSGSTGSSGSIGRSSIGRSGSIGSGSGSIGSSGSSGSGRSGSIGSGSGRGGEVAVVLMKIQF